MNCKYCDKPILPNTDTTHVRDTDWYFHAVCFNRGWTDELIKRNNTTIEYEM